MTPFKPISRYSESQYSTALRSTFFQPKLSINNPNDSYEQEADSVADKVMRMEDPGIQLKSFAISTIQRKCAACEEEEKKPVQRKEIENAPELQMKVEPQAIHENSVTLAPVPFVQRACAVCEANEKEKVQRKEKGEESMEENNLDSYVSRLDGGGQQLPNDVKNFYEPRFGHDFSNVKIHTDNAAAKSAQSINALAYTSGTNIVFNSGQYLPNTDSGKRLLGHELTHVVQQSGHLSSTIQLKPTKKKKAASAGSKLDQQSDEIAIAMPWRNTVLNTMFQYMRPYALFGENKLDDQAILAAVEADIVSLQADGYYINYEENGKTVNKEHVRIAEFERLMNQQNLATFTLRSPETLLHRLGLTWPQYQDMTKREKSIKEAQDLLDVVTDLPVGRFQDLTTEVILSPNIKKQDQVLVDRFLSELREGLNKQPAANDENKVLITDSDIEAIKNFYSKDDVQRKKLLDILKGGTKGKSPRHERISIHSMLETAEATQTLNEDDIRFNRKKGSAADEEPIVHRPIRGKINISNDPIIAGTKAKFNFIIEDPVDAFRVPMVGIFWNAVDDKKKIIDHEVTKYIEVRGDGWINDKTFEVKFDNPGMYLIYARVQHNFYKPRAFNLPVNVITEDAALNKMREDEPKEESIVTKTGDFKDINYDMGGLSDIGSYDEGERAYGELKQTGAPQLSFDSDIKKLDQQIASLNELKAHYATSGDTNKDIIAWIEKRTKNLNETKTKLTGSRNKPGNKGIQVRGFYASRKAGIRSGPLSLVAWYEKISNNPYIPQPYFNGHLYDRSEISENEDLHFQAPALTYEKMLEQLFVEISGDYPDGKMEISFQLVDENEQPTNKMVTYRRVTDTVGGDIYGAVFESAPAQIIANAVALLLTMFPPTTALGIGLGLAYNSVPVIANIEKRLSTGRDLRASDILDAALVLLDLVPVFGKLAKEGSVAYKVIRISSEVAQIGGQMYVVTDNVLTQIEQVRSGLVADLSETYKRVRLMQSNKAPVALQRQELDRMKMLEGSLRTAAAEITAEMVMYQAAIMGAQHLLRKQLQNYVDKLPADQRKKLGFKDTDIHTRSDADPHSSKDPVNAGLPPLKEHPNMKTDATPGLEGAYVNPKLGEHEVRVRYEAEADGYITRIFIEAGVNAGQMHFNEHIRTVKSLQLYQGLSGKVRVALIRLNNFFAKVMQMPEKMRPGPKSKAFEAKLEIEKLPAIIQARSAMLANPNLPLKDRVRIEAEVSHYEAEILKYQDTLAKLDMEMGKMYVAASAPPTKGKDTSADVEPDIDVGGSSPQKKEPVPAKSDPVAPAKPAVKEPKANTHVLLDSNGELTKEGIAHLRVIRKKQFAGKSDAEIVEIFRHGKGGGHLLEAVHKEEMRRGNKLTAQNPPGRRGFNILRGGLESIIRRLGILDEGLLRDRDVALEVVGQNTMDFVTANPVLAERMGALLNSPNANVRREALLFFWGQGGNDARKTSAFLFGDVGNKRPDHIEVSVSRREIVITDSTQKTTGAGAEIHQFKTLFYRTVFEMLTNYTVSAVEKSAKQTIPVGD